MTHYPLSVLVVDDDPDIVQSEADLLTLCGHVAHCAGNGQEAMQIAKQNQPDVVLLDLRMPGMDGWKLAAELKEMSKPPLLIAITGYGQQQDYDRSDEAGIHLHLIKPVEPAVLYGLLNRVAQALAPQEPPGAETCCLHG